MPCEPGTIMTRDQKNQRKKIERKLKKSSFDRLKS